MELVIGGKNIYYVRAIHRADKPESTAITHLLCNEEWKTRSYVIEEILNNKESRYLTFTEEKTSADIIVVEIKGKLYLKTISNNKEEDNLGNLPEL